MFKHACADKQQCAQIECPCFRDKDGDRENHSGKNNPKKKMKLSTNRDN